VHVRSILGAPTKLPRWKLQRNKVEERDTVLGEDLRAASATPDFRIPHLYLREEGGRQWIHRHAARLCACVCVRLRVLLLMTCEGVSTGKGKKNQDCATRELTSTCHGCGYERKDTKKVRQRVQAEWRGKEIMTRQMQSEVRIMERQQQNRSTENNGKQNDFIPSRSRTI
jgi:hypothetical protein